MQVSRRCKVIWQMRRLAKQSVQDSKQRGSNGNAVKQEKAKPAAMQPAQQPAKQQQQQQVQSKQSQQPRAQPKKDQNKPSSQPQQASARPAAQAPQYKVVSRPADAESSAMPQPALNQQEVAAYWSKIQQQGKVSPPAPTQPTAPSPSPVTPAAATPAPQNPSAVASLLKNMLRIGATDQKQDSAPPQVDTASFRCSCSACRRQCARE